MTALTLPPQLARPAGPAAILGAGVSGLGARELLTALGIGCTLFDERDRVFTEREAARHPLVVYSPGFRRDHGWLALARAARADCWGELDFASLFWKGRVVAVTGTNGKTTLTEFLVHALTAGGQTAAAAGNIGLPLAQLVAGRDGGRPGEIAVCEVSSFQAEGLRHFRAEAALWTNFAEDHLERHAGMSEYFAAKARLASRSAAVFAGSSVRRYARGAGPLDWADRAVWVDTEDLPPDAALAGTVFAQPPQRENFVLAAAWWARAGLEPAPLYAAARTFALGRHRLSRVAEIGGVTYWNDSKATNFHAVEAALTRFPQGVWLIAGGKGKGGDIAGFVRRLAGRVRELLLIGETAPQLADAAARADIPHRRFDSLGAAVAAAARAARRGDHVLLSPGFASFDQFRNYQDRGDQFEAAVRGLTAAIPVAC